MRTKSVSHGPGSRDASPCLFFSPNHMGTSSYKRKPITSSSHLARVTANKSWRFLDAWDGNQSHPSNLGPVKRQTNGGIREISERDTCAATAGSWGHGSRLLPNRAPLHSTPPPPPTLVRGPHHPLRLSSVVCMQAMAARRCSPGACCSVGSTTQAHLFSDAAGSVRSRGTFVNLLSSPVSRVGGQGRFIGTLLLN
jgi:hypothetical protein